MSTSLSRIPNLADFAAFHHGMSPFEVLIA